MTITGLPKINVSTVNTYLIVLKNRATEVLNGQASKRTGFQRVCSQRKTLESTLSITSPKIIVKARLAAAPKNRLPFNEWAAKLSTPVRYENFKNH